MTDELLITPGVLIDHGWQFTVQYSGHRHTVVCRQVYWNKLTHGEISPQELVRLAFHIAMKHRIADALPEQIDVELLADRIVDFEKDIRRESRIEAAGNPR